MRKKQRPIRPICGNCSYWKRTQEGVQKGECRRRNIKLEMVPLNYWCGEHDLYSQYIKEKQAYDNEILDKMLGKEEQ